MQNSWRSGLSVSSTVEPTVACIVSYAIASLKHVNLLLMGAKGFYWSFWRISGGSFGRNSELVQPYHLKLMRHPVSLAGHKHPSSLNLAWHFKMERLSGDCFVNFVRNWHSTHLHDLVLANSKTQNDFTHTDTSKFIKRQKQKKIW